MKGKTAYKIIPYEKLIVQFYSGDIVKDDIISLQKFISSELDYNPGFDIVADFSEANLLLNENEDLNAYTDFIKEFPKIQGKRKAAYITSKPNEVVLATLFSMLIKDTQIQGEVFSTTLAASKWLNKKGVSNKFLSSVINDLKNIA